MQYNRWFPGLLAGYSSCLPWRWLCPISLKHEQSINNRRGRSSSSASDVTGVIDPRNKGPGWKLIKTLWPICTSKECKMPTHRQWRPLQRVGTYSVLCLKWIMSYSTPIASLWKGNYLIVVITFHSHPSIGYCM